MRRVAGVRAVQANVFSFFWGYPALESEGSISVGIGVSRFQVPLSSFLFHPTCPIFGFCSAASSSESLSEEMKPASWTKVTGSFCSAQPLTPPLMMKTFPALSPIVLTR